MNVLKEFNQNSYLILCNTFIEKLELIKSFLYQMREEKDFSKIIELKKIYERIFNYSITLGAINLKTSTIKNIKPISHIEIENSIASHFIDLKIVHPKFKKLDEIYQKRLSSLLRFYRTIYSIIDSPTKRIMIESSMKYQSLIDQIKNDFQGYLNDQSHKNLIEKREKLKERDIKNLPFNGFYHMTHISNLYGILEDGLLSHVEARFRNKIQFDISNKRIQAKRNRIENTYGKNIQEYVPLYINPLNPMMDSEKVNQSLDDIVLLEIIPHILVQKNKTLFSDGNASEEATNFYGDPEKLERVPWDLLQLGKWSENSDLKRVMCSEVLIPNKIDTYFINKIYVKDSDNLDRIFDLFPNHKGINIEIQPDFFKTKNQ